jgi:hypothetical protein
VGLFLFILLSADIKRTGNKLNSRVREVWKLSKDGNGRKIGTDFDLFIQKSGFSYVKAIEK